MVYTAADMVCRTACMKHEQTVQSSEDAFTGQRNRHEEVSASALLCCKLVVVVVPCKTELDRKIFAVVHRVELSEEDVTGDENRATGMRNVKGNDSGSTTTTQVHDVILVIELVSIAVDNVGDRLQILNV